MIGSMTKTVRVLFASLLTILLLPCLGFSVFGFLASGEPGTSFVWYLIYSFFILLFLLAIFFFWWSALRRLDIDLKSICSGCGYNLRGIVDPRCPECGAPVASD